jgi:hypothetical protein
MQNASFDSLTGAGGGWQRTRGKFFPRSSSVNFLSMRGFVEQRLPNPPDGSSLRDVPLLAVLCAIEAGPLVPGGQAQAHGLVDGKGQDQRSDEGDAVSHADSGAPGEAFAPMGSKFLLIPYCLFTDEVSKTDHKLSPPKGLY